MIFFSTLLNETKRLLSNVSVLTVCIIGPIVYFFLYPTPYANNIINAQNIAVIDKDDTHLSHQLTFLANASPDINIKTYTTSITHAQHLIEKGKIFGVLYIPKGFEKDTYLQNSPHLSFLANSSYFLIYGAIVNGLHEATEALNPFIKEKRRIIYGIQNPDYHTQKNLLTLKSSPLFNPSLGYISYALSAIFIVILHQMILVGMGIFGSTYQGNASIISLLTSRSLLFGFLCVLLFAFYFGFGFHYYGIKHQANPIDFWLLSFIFIFSIVSFGNCFSLLITRSYRATMIILISSLPLVFLLGFIWPSFAIPKPINFILQFIPLFHGVNALLRLNEMGASFYAISNYCINLIGLGIFYTLLTLLIAYIRGYPLLLSSRITESQAK